MCKAIASLKHLLRQSKRNVFSEIKAELTHLAQVLAEVNRCSPRVWVVGGSLNRINLKTSINCPLSLKTASVLEEKHLFGLPYGESR